MLCGQGANGFEHGDIHDPSVKQICSKYHLYVCFVGGIEERGIVGRIGVLYFGSVLWLIPSMGRWFVPFGHIVLEALECAFHIPRHEYCDMARIVIPGEREPAILCAFPILAVFVADCCERGHEVFRISAACILNTKIVNDQCKV